MTSFGVRSANKEFAPEETKGITWWGSSYNSEESLYKAICRM